MFNQRYLPVVQAVAAIAGIWLLAGVGYRLAQRAEITADQVQSYVQTVDLSGLTGADRAAAIQKLETLFNALSLADHQQVWPEIQSRWVAGMTDAEQTQFLAATTLPGFKPALNPFDLLPADRRQQAVDEALKKLRDARAQSLSGPEPAAP